MSRGRVSFAEKDAVRETRDSEQEEAQADDYFSVEGSVGDVRSPGRGRRASLSIRIPPRQHKADMAFAALQYLPMPVLVLSGEKTVVLANEAMGRLFGIDLDASPTPDEADAGDLLSQIESHESRSPSDVLFGATLAQLGVDLLLNGTPVFVAWGDFLETIVDDASRAQSSGTQLNTYHSQDTDKDTTPTSRSRRSMSAASSARSGTRTEVHDAVVDVVFSTNRDPMTGLPLVTRQDASAHVQAQMIVSVWATEDAVFYTLTFTAAKVEQASPAATDGAKSTSRTVSRATTGLTMSEALSSNSSSGSSGHKRAPNQPGTPLSAGGLTSPHALPLMDFLPRGPPAKSSAAAPPTMFSKMNRLKDALMNSMNIPAYAMWKDESFGLPNKAIIRLIYPWIEDGVFDSNEQARDFVSRYRLYKDDFSEELRLDEFPIMRLMKEQKAFDMYRVGMYSAKDGSRMVFDTSGQPLLDDKGEFLGGVVLFHDVTDYAEMITRQQEENAKQFEDITNRVPIMYAY